MSEFNTTYSFKFVFLVDQFVSNYFELLKQLLLGLVFAICRLGQLLLSIQSLLLKLTLERRHLVLKLFDLRCCLVHVPQRTLVLL